MRVNVWFRNERHELRRVSRNTPLREIPVTDFEAVRLSLLEFGGVYAHHEREGQHGLLLLSPVELAECVGEVPYKECPCFFAFCAKCDRARIDTESAGRHMLRRNGFLVCHECGREIAS